MGYARVGSTPTFGTKSSIKDTLNVLSKLQPEMVEAFFLSLSRSTPKKADELMSVSSNGANFYLSFSHKTV